MGCLLKSFGLIIIFVLLIPVILMLSLFGRARTIKVHRHKPEDEQSQYGDDHTQHQNDQTTGAAHPNKPIDQSTVEYIDFEEVKDNDSNK